MALKRALRLRHSSDFRRVRQQGRSVSSRLLILSWAAHPGDQPRIGFVVSRRISRLAVQRNRIKRLLSEALRPLLPQLSGGWDIVISARQQAAHVDVHTFGRDLDFLLHRARLLEAARRPEVQQSSKGRQP